MKTPLFILSILVTRTFLQSCQNSDSEQEQAKAAVKEAEADLDEAYLDLDQALFEEELAIFLKEAESKIIANDERITELKTKRAEPGNAIDPVYSKRIELLEKQNADIRSKIAIYKNEQTDWKILREEISQEMDELIKSINDLSEK